MIRQYSKWLVLLAAIGLLALVFIYNNQKMAEQANRPIPVQDEVSHAADVAVMKVTNDRYAVTVEGFGIAEPHNRMTLTAQISGRVEDIAEAFETGRSVNAGDLLLTLESSDYRSALANAEHDLASARVDLLEAEREAEQARIEWKSSGLDGEPDSPLVLHEPQVTAARAALTMAEAAVASARKDLEQTQIRAPFDALIVTRSVAPGSYLQAGGEVAELYSTDRVEIAIPLSQRDWSNLPDVLTLNKGEWPVSLTSVETGQQWEGYIRRAEQHLDDTSRQQSLIAALDLPLKQTPALSPGTFVQAEITGREQENLWRLPSSALSQRGEIWYESNGVLRKFSAETLATDKDAIYIRPPTSLMGQQVNVLTQPLSSYLPGMAVNPVEAAHE